jgi:hypothetical protein
MMQARKGMIGAHGLRWKRIVGLIEIYTGEQTKRSWKGNALKRQQDLKWKTVAFYKKSLAL